MRKTVIAFFIMLFYTLSFAKENININLNSLFVENKGQIKDKSIKYYLKSDKVFIGILDNGSIKYLLKGDKGIEIFEEILGKNLKNITITGQQTDTTLNYFRSNKQITDIKTFSQITLKDNKNKVSIKLKLNKNRFEKIFILEPYSDLSSLQVRLKGIKNISINENGELVVKLNNSIKKFSKPVAFQVIKGKKVPVEIKYRLINKNTYSFTVKNYDRTKKLIIDPVFYGATFGGSNEEFAKVIASDNDSVYIAGFTRSEDFPAKNGFDNTYNGKQIIENVTFNEEEGVYLDESGNEIICDEYIQEEKKCIAYNRDIFVIKLDKTLKHIKSATFIGGSNSDRADSILIDSNNIIIVGSSYSSDFPVTHNIAGDIPDNHGNWDIIISILNKDLNNLIKSVKIGGSKKDRVTDAKLHNGHIYIYGYTKSDDFPTTPDSYKPIKDIENDYDAFLMKVDTSLSQIKASTFFGGDQKELTFKFDIYNNLIYGTGLTFSKTLADSGLPGANKSFNKGDTSQEYFTDGFVFKMSEDLKNLYSWTYIGGSEIDRANDVKIFNNSVYIIGFTHSEDFPVSENAIKKELTGDYQPYEFIDEETYYLIYKRPLDVFAVRMDLNLENILNSTYLGGSSHDNGNNLFIDNSGNIYISGFTISKDFPITDNAVKKKPPEQNKNDGFLTILSSDLGSILYSTFIGGKEQDSVWDFYVDQTHNVFVLGTTNSPDFIKTLGKTKKGKDKDIFVISFNWEQGEIVKQSKGKGGGCSLSGSTNTILLIISMLILLRALKISNRKKIKK